MLGSHAHGAHGTVLSIAYNQHWLYTRNKAEPKALSLTAAPRSRCPSSPRVALREFSISLDSCYYLPAFTSQPQRFVFTIISCSIGLQVVIFLIDLFLKMVLFICFSVYLWLAFLSGIGRELRVSKVWLGVSSKFQPFWCKVRWLRCLYCLLCNVSCFALASFNVFPRLWPSAVRL